MNYYFSNRVHQHFSYQKGCDIQTTCVDASGIAHTFELLVDPLGSPSTSFSLLIDSGSSLSLCLSGYMEEVSFKEKRKRHGSDITNIQSIVWCCSTNMMCDCPIIFTCYWCESYFELTINTMPSRRQVYINQQIVKHEKEETKKR